MGRFPGDVLQVWDLGISISKEGMEGDAMTKRPCM